MSNNKQALEMTNINTPLLSATQGKVTQGLSMEDRDASTSTPIIDKKTIEKLLNCAKIGENRGKQPSPSICKVFGSLRDLSARSFIPQLVSIGPIHREKKKLKEFEWQKECYLNDLLNRCDSTPKETLLEACLLKVNTLIPKIRKSYACVIDNCSDDELAGMMVMDGCFILEFCFKHEEADKYLPNKMQNIRIAMDLMLLENQVPFSVLQALFKCSMGEVHFTLNDVLDEYLVPYIKIFRSDLLPEKKSIISNILDKYLAPYIKLFRPLSHEKKSFTDVDSDLPEKISTTDVSDSIFSKYLAPCVKRFCSLLPEKSSTTDVDSDLSEITTDVDSDSTPPHVLGYLHKRYQLLAAKSLKPIHEEASNLVDEEQAAKSWNPVGDEALRGHTIVELDRSGMNFKPHQEDEWSMTIKFQSSFFSRLPWFWGKPTLLMPTMVIQDTTELILRNFIAYEQLLQDRYYFTSYAHAMDKLIDTQEDIAKLVESKVLLNMLVSNQVAADMINTICKTLFVTDFYYAQEFNQMDKYCNRFWIKNKRTYFSNPWNAFNLLVGFIVFLATVVSAIIAVLEYFG